MAIHYFKKTQIQNAFFAHGKRVEFEGVEENRGVLAIDDADESKRELLNALTAAANAHKLGVVAITESDYILLKKKPLLRQFVRKSLMQPIRAHKAWNPLDSAHKLPKRTPAQASPSPSNAGKVGAQAAVAGAGRKAPAVRLPAQALNPPGKFKPALKPLQPPVPQVTS